MEKKASPAWTDVAFSIRLLTKLEFSYHVSLCVKSIELHNITINPLQCDF